MCTPLKGFHGMPSISGEIVSAMSALNMEAQPIPDDQLRPELLERKNDPGEYVFLSEVDVWANHAMEHLKQAREHQRTFNQQFRQVLSFVFQNIKAKKLPEKEGWALYQMLNNLVQS